MEVKRPVSMIERGEVEAAELIVHSRPCALLTALKGMSQSTYSIPQRVFLTCVKYRN